MNGFPDGWAASTLGSTGRWLSGGTPNTATAEFWNGDIPWISSGSLTSFRIRESERNITALGARNGTRMVEPRTILMVVRGMSLKTEFRMGITQRPVAFGQDCKALIARPGILPEFLAYAIKAKSPEILGIVDEAGHGTGRLNTDQLHAIEIGIPDLNEQQAIAEVLGALDDKIAANATLAFTMGELGRALYREACQSAPARVTLSTVAKNVPGRYLAKSAYADDGPYFVYGSNSVMGKHDKALCKGGFSVLAKIGSYCGNLRWSQRPAWVNNNASAIVPQAGITPSILRYALESVDMAPHRAGSGQPYIRMDSLFATQIEVPNDDAALSIGPVLEQLTEAETVASEENESLAATRDALLPQLMSGKLRVKDAESLVAEAV